MIQFSKPSISLSKANFKKVQKIITSGWVSIGKNMEELENYFQKRFKVKYAIACSCATQGLTIAFKAAGWRNKRILVPSFTWPSTVYAIESNIGNTVVFCDIDPLTWLIDIDSVDKTSYDCIVAVDTFGNQADIKTNKPVIYDAAHGFDLPAIGNRGLVEVVSFSFTKIVSASEGGMILTNDKNIAETCYELRRLSARMGEINAVIALESIANYKSNFQKKLKLIDNYRQLLKIEYVEQKIPEATNYSVFSILVKNRNQITEQLRKNSIEFKTYYEPLVEGLKHTDKVYSSILSLPLYPALTFKEQEEICRTINSSPSTTPGTTYLRKSGYLETFLQKQK